MDPTGQCFNELNKAEEALQNLHLAAFNLTPPDREALRLLTAKALSSIRGCSTFLVNVEARFATGATLFHTE